MIRKTLPCLAACSVLLALAACGHDRSAPAERRERALAKSPLPPAPPAPTLSPYDADGTTLSVAERPVLGVAVPRASRTISERPDIARVVIDRVPIAAVERFYQKYLQTGRVERLRAGVRFGDATPKAPGNPRARVEVYVQRSARGTLIAIYDESPTHVKAPQGDEAVRQARGLPGPVDFTKRIRGVTE